MVQMLLTLMCQASRLTATGQRSSHWLLHHHRTEGVGGVGWEGMDGWQGGGWGEWMVGVGSGGGGGRLWKLYLATSKGWYLFFKLTSLRTFQNSSPISQRLYGQSCKYWWHKFHIYIYIYYAETCLSLCSSTYRRVNSHNRSHGISSQLIT